jgi:sugar lactone lactonase YvrE
MIRHKKILHILYGLFAAVMFFVSCKKDEAFTHNPGAAMTIDDFTAKQGGGGTEILITGSNFSTDTSQVEVTINGNKLAIIGANATQVMAVVPKKCGSGNIVVKIGSDSAVSAGIFNYVFTRTVSTLAGNGTAGFANGAGADAMFNFNGEIWYRSMGLVVDDNLNVYVADPGNHCIRKIDSMGNVSTFAGNPGNSGYADGQGTAAKFSLPYDLAIDAEGNIYSVDPGNWDIRKISPDGNAVTWAWGWQAPWSVDVDKTTGYVYYSSCDGSGNVHQVPSQWNTNVVVSGLNYPAGIKFDKDGNLYASINGENVIRKFTAGTWESSIIAGQQWTAGYLNATGTEAKFDHPWGLAVDADGNIYVAGNGTWDGGTYNTDQSVRYIQSGTWNVSTFAGSGTAGYADAIGEAAAFSAPTGVAVDKNGTLYVLDKNNNRVRKIVSE